MAFFAGLAFVALLVDHNSALDAAVLGRH